MRHANSTSTRPHLWFFGGEGQVRGGGTTYDRTPKTNSLRISIRYQIHTVRTLHQKSLTTVCHCAAWVWLLQAAPLRLCEKSPATAAEAAHHALDAPLALAPAVRLRWVCMYRKHIFRSRVVQINVCQERHHTSSFINTYSVTGKTRRFVCVVWQVLVLRSKASAAALPRQNMLDMRIDCGGMDWPRNASACECTQ